MGPWIWFSAIFLVFPTFLSSFWPISCPFQLTPLKISAGISSIRPDFGVDGSSLNQLIAREEDGFGLQGLGYLRQSLRERESRICLVGGRFGNQDPLAHAGCDAIVGRVGGLGRLT